MLGAVFAILAAATFAFNNATARRGVITGTALQGMAVTIPVGLLCFIPAALLTGAATTLAHLPARSIAWMAGVGVLHFVFGRFCNYRANQAAGVNLTAPVVQLQVFVSVVLAVVILHEPCTVLQLAGGIVMLAGSLITQRQPVKAREESLPPSRANPGEHTFLPRRTAGYLFASLAALAYGTSPIMARTALAHTGVATGLLGGMIAYGAATAAMMLGLALPTLRANVWALRRENVQWFLYSGVFVAAAQGFFYSALSIAPIMLVAPLMQLSLVFRFGFANALTPHHEVFGLHVIIGSALSILGACMISVDTNLILHALPLPLAVDEFLRWRISSG
jgi:drug/metabolite transporter (DMT)-like permease